MPTDKQLYRHFLRQFPFCWACGRTASHHDKPLGWYGPWQLERHHLVSKPRVEDIRAISALCSICHRIAHGERLIIHGRRWHLPRLERCHLLYLKRLIDPNHYDRPWLQRHCAERLPTAKKPPLCYVLEYESRQGVLA